MTRARDTIRIHSLSTNCIIGVYPQEREQEQTLRVSLRLDLDLARAGLSGELRHSCDYERVSREVGALLSFRRYRLLEVACEELAAMLLGVHPELTGVAVELVKPAALGGRGEVSVAIERQPSDYPRKRETSRFGTVDILVETAEAGLYLLHVDPGKSITPHTHKIMHELEWMVAGELIRNGEPVEEDVWSPVIWPLGTVQCYENRTERRGTVFCCDRPKFIPADEILVVQHGNPVPA
ncbi:MAG: dihydroneopterin aldolase [Nannocystaceae bacterium]